jgi:hypothetical protein
VRTSSTGGRPARPLFFQRSKNAAPLMTKPGVQKPHWSASASTMARCTGWSSSSDVPVASPSTVVTFAPSTSIASVRQPFRGAPST